MGANAGVFVSIVNELKPTRMSSARKSRSLAPRWLVLVIIHGSAVSWKTSFVITLTTKSDIPIRSGLFEFLK